jgi:hypothetical protein
MTEV